MMTTTIDPLAQICHDAFVEAVPELAEELRKLVAAGRPRERIVARVAAVGASDWLLNEVEREMDYLNAPRLGQAA